MVGRVELRAVTGPDYGRIWDHELVGAVRKIAGDGTGNTNWKVLGVIDWATMTYNPFGIKAERGQSFVMAGTHEETKGHKLVATIAPFRIFPSMNEAFDQHGRLLATHPAYKLARQYMNNPDAYADALTGSYATDSKYGSKIKSIMKQNFLYKYNL